MTPIPQQPKSIDFIQLHSIEELNEATVRMASLAAPCKSLLLPLAMKKRNREMRLILLSRIHHY
jgi:hypothetical protein